MKNWLKKWLLLIWKMLKLTSKLLLPLLVVFLLSPMNPASAGGQNGNHLSLNLGHTNLDNLSGPGDESFRFRRGQTVALAWGGQVGALRTEYRFSYSRSDLARFYKNSSSSNDGRIEQYALSLNFHERRSLPPFRWDYRAFWFLGLGLSRVELDASDANQSSYDDHDYSWKLRGGLGLEVPLTENSFLAAGGEIFSTESLSFEDQAGEDQSFGSLDGRSLFLEYRWLY